MAITMSAPNSPTLIEYNGRCSASESVKLGSLNFAVADERFNSFIAHLKKLLVRTFTVKSV